MGKERDGKRKGREGIGIRRDRYGNGKGWEGIGMGMKRNGMGKGREMDAKVKGWEGKEVKRK